MLGIVIPDGVPSRELRNVAVQMLLAQMVVGALIASLEHGPKGLHSNYMGLSSDVLANAVLHRLVVEGQALVGAGLIGVHGRARRGVLADKALQGRLVGCRDRPGGYAIGCTILRTDHGGLADRAAPRELRPFRLRHVLAASADVCLIDLDRPGKQHPLALVEAFADALEQKPCRRLSNPDLAIELHAGRALEPGGHHVERDDPLLQPEFAGLHDRALANGEVTPAVPAPIRHGLAAGDSNRIGRAAVRAEPAFRPPLFLEPPLRRRVVGKHLEQFDDCQSFPVRLAWTPFRHCPYPSPNRASLSFLASNMVVIRGGVEEKLAS